MHGIVWIDSAPTLRIDGDGCELLFTSGELRFVHRMSRANLRRMVECASRALHDADARETVLHFPMREEPHAALSNSESIASACS